MAGIIFIFFACLLWAADTLIRYPLLFGGSSAQQIVLFEHLFLVTVIVGIFISQRRKIKFLRHQTLFPFIVIGIFGSALGTLAFTEAFFLANPTVVIILQKLQPVIAVTLASLLLKEKINPRFFLWLALALLGSFLLIWPDLNILLSTLNTGSIEHNNQVIWGYLLALFAVISWGGATVFGKKLTSQGIDSVDLMAGRFSFGLLGMLPFMFITPSLITTVEINILQKILLLALISGIVGMYLYYQGLKRIPAHWATLAEMFFPVAAIFINWLFLSIEINQIQLLGAVTLVAASTMVQFHIAMPSPLKST